MVGVRQGALRADRLGTPSKAPGWGLAHARSGQWERGRLVSGFDADRLREIAARIADIGEELVQRCDELEHAAVRAREGAADEQRTEIIERPAREAIALVEFLRAAGFHVAWHAAGLRSAWLVRMGEARALVGRIEPDGSFAATSTGEISELRDTLARWRAGREARLILEGGPGWEERFARFMAARLGKLAESDAFRAGLN